MAKTGPSVKVPWRSLTWTASSSGLRGHWGRTGPSQGVIERGADGRVGLWMDPAVAEEAVYRERWAARGKVAVLISGGRIVIAAVDDH